MVPVFLELLGLFGIGIFFGFKYSVSSSEDTFGLCFKIGVITFDLFGLFGAGLLISKTCTFSSKEILLFDFQISSSESVKLSFEKTGIALTFIFQIILQSGMDELL